MRYTALFLAIASASAMAQETKSSSPLVFDEMVVTATKTENSVAEAPASMSVITASQIMSEPSITVNEMIEKSVGVESRKEGGRGGRESVSIRGMDSSYTLIMVNGRRMSSSNAVVRGNDFDLAAIPKENIERIEVIRGPMSALYGSEALGGVVNIITKQPINEWNSSASFDLSSPMDGNGGVEMISGINTGGALIDDTLYMNIAVNKTEREAWTPFKGGYSAATALEARDTLNLSGAMSWYINDNHVIDFDVTHSNDEREALRRHGKVSKPADLQAIDTNFQRTNLSLSHSGSWDSVESQLRVYTDKVKINEVDKAYSAEATTVTESNYTTDGSVSLDLDSHRLTMGGDVRYTTLDNPKDLTQTGEASVNQQALFLQDEWSLTDALTLTYGGRADHHQEFGFEFSPRAYLVFNATDGLTLKGGVGQAFKAPSLLQLSDQYKLSSCKGECKIQGNPNLQPETSLSYELAANYQHERWEAELSLFRNDVENLIERDFDNLLGTYPIPSTTPGEADKVGEIYTYKNVNKAVIQGVEIGARIVLLDNLSVSGNYTYTDTEDKSTGLRLSDRPDQNINAQVDWQITENLTTFARASYIGEQMIDDLAEDGYALFDLGMNYTINDKFQVRAGVSNLGDTQMSDAAGELGYTEDPRTYYVGFSTNF